MAVKTIMQMVKEIVSHKFPDPEDDLGDNMTDIQQELWDSSNLEIDYKKMQAQYIAAYTGRQPKDITADELDNCQDFWDTHADALADVIACNIGGHNAKSIKYLLHNEIFPDWNFFGANLQKAYKMLAEDKRTIVDNALGRGYAVYSRAYAKAAILPKFEALIIKQLSDEQKRLFSNAIKDKEQPEDKEQAALFALYVMLYDMADDDLKEKAAAAIGLTTGDFKVYLWETGGAPNMAEFPPDHTAEKTKEEQAEAIVKAASVKTKLPQLPRQRYGTGFYPLTLAYINKSLLGIPLDGQYHTIGNGDYTFRVRFTIEKNSGFLPNSLDDWAEKISTIIAIGREIMPDPYFDVNAIARYITHGDPDEHTETIVKTGKNAGNIVTKLAKVPKATSDLIDTMIDFMTGIKADIEFPIWKRDKNGKKNLVKLKISRPLLNGGVRVEISNYGHTTNTYGRGEAKVKQSLRVWGFPSIREDSELKSYVPVLYDIAKQLGEIAQIPKQEADIRHYLPNGTYITAEDISLRDAALRRFFEIQRNGGNGILRLAKIEEETGIKDNSKWTTTNYRARKQRQRKLENIVKTFVKDGKIRSAAQQKDGKTYDIQTEEYRPKRSKKKKTPKK